MEKEITEAYQIIKKYEASLREDKFNSFKIFSKNIDQLISETPTGDLRNKICDLNILFLHIMEIGV